MSSQPKITIVTVTLNAARHLAETVASVAGQSYPNIEYIVVDGASTDGTVDIIRAHESAISRWISEPDPGIASAMNKGVGMASGEFIMFLHGDDYLLDSGSVAAAVRCLDREHDIFAFGVHFESGGRRMHLRPRAWNWLINFKMGFCHQGVLCRRVLFERIGLFDPTFGINMDYDFFLRAYRAGYRARVRDKPIAVMRSTGVSSRRDWSALDERFREERRVQRKNATALYNPVLYAMYWSLYRPYRRMRALLSSAQAHA